MPTLALCTILAALLLLSVGGVVLAQPKPPPATAEDQRILPYVEADQLVDIGGRRINLHCTGTRSPTIRSAASVLRRHRRRGAGATPGESTDFDRFAGHETSVFVSRNTTIHCSKVILP
jgi:hypothetical protein